MVGKTVFNTGVGIVVGSVGVYAMLALYQTYLFITGQPSSADGMAIPIACFLLGLFVAAVGWAIDDRTQIR